MLKLLMQFIVHKPNEPTSLEKEQELSCHWQAARWWLKNFYLFSII